MSNPDRISPYLVETMPSRLVMRIKKNINWRSGGLVVDPIPNSPNSYHKNCVAD